MGAKIKKEDKIGEKSINFQGLEMVITDWTNSGNIVVEFLGEHKDKRFTSYGHFKDGQVKNRYFPTIYGVGWIGDEKISISKNNKETAYKTWSNMLRRCYDEYYKAKEVKAYLGCTVDDTWFSYPNFKKWFDENYYEVDGEMMHLDKDILVKGNKIYSQNTCIYVPSKINYLFTYEKLGNNGLPYGVSKTLKNDSNAYRVRLHIDNKETHIGNCNTLKEAFNLYKEAKENNIKRMADIYKDKIPQKLYDRLMEYEVTYEY